MCVYTYINRYALWGAKSHWFPAEFGLWERPRSCACWNWIHRPGLTLSCWCCHGSLNVPMFHITQPLGIWSIMATIRWCPIFPKWDIYQPLVVLMDSDAPGHSMHLQHDRFTIRIDGCVHPMWRMAEFGQVCAEMPKWASQMLQTMECADCGWPPHLQQSAYHQGRRLLSNFTLWTSTRQTSNPHLSPVVMGHSHHMHSLFREPF